MQTGLSIQSPPRDRRAITSSSSLPEGTHMPLARRVLSWLDDNTERYLMVAFYAALALIISVEVGRRYHGAADTVGLHGQHLLLHLAELAGVCLSRQAPNAFAV
ncbi:MAG: hypothetical protein R3E94_12575 [Burkholderiaceae bacterium]